MISTNTYKLVLSDAHYNAKLSVDVNVTIPPGEKKKHHYMRHYISRILCVFKLRRENI